MTHTRLGCFALLALLAGLTVACHKKVIDPEPQPAPAPNAPRDLIDVSHTSHSATIRWNDRADNEDGFFIYLRTSEDTLWTRADTVGRDVVEARLEGLRAATVYRFRVTAYNANGESDPSAELLVETVGVLPPAAPYDLAAIMVGERAVGLSWQDSVDVDSFLIERRSGTEAWALIGSTPSGSHLFRDSLVTVETQYSYRVGAAGEGGVGWSLDSVVIITPLAGVPLPPDSLTATSELGVGVRLSWLDRSWNETGFIIGRSLLGHIPVVIDTVAANAVSYFDSLGAMMNHYNYYVRAYNDTGASAWCLRATIDYRYCSSGLIPLCLGNYWEYHVDTSAAPAYMVHREVLSYAFVDSIDYYLMGQHPGVAGDFQNLYYLRNYDNIGTLVLRYPLPVTPQPEVLFYYPAPMGNNFWTALGDCVVVTATNTSVQLFNGDTYDHLYAYQRFYSAAHSVQFFIQPGLGIVREDEWLNGNRTRRDLTHAVVDN